MVKLFLVACLSISVSAHAIGGRGGGGRGGAGESSGRGGREGGYSFGSPEGGRSGIIGSHYGDAAPRGSFSEHRPGVVTAQEEGGKIPGHDYDPDGTDRTERVRHSSDFPIFSGGHLSGWQSASEAQASEAAREQTHQGYVFALLSMLLVGAVAICWVVFH